MCSPKRSDGPSRLEANSDSEPAGSAMKLKHCLRGGVIESVIESESESD